MSTLNKFAAPLLLTIIAILSVWPSVLYFSKGVVETYDGLLIVWILNQTIHKIPYDLANIFQSNIFYPFENTLAFSVLMIPSAFLSYLPVRLTGAFVSASNFTIVFGQIATMLIAYLWFKDISDSRTSSFIASITLGLSKIRMNYFVHLQMWTMHFWLFSGWMIWRYFKYKKSKYLFLGAVFWGIQLWENVLPFYFVALLFGILVTLNFRSVLDNLKHLVVGGLIVGLISFPVVKTYYEVSSEHDFNRTIRDAAHFSAGIDEFSGQFFSPALFLLFGAALIKLGRDKKVVKTDTKWIIILLLISFVFTLGPVVKWGGETVKLAGRIPIPLPYAFSYYLIPGLNALRTTSRWIWISAFSASALFSYAFRDLSLRKNLTVIILFLFIVIVGGTRIKSFYIMPDVENIPDVYLWLKDQDRKTIIEIPMYVWSDGKGYQQEFSRLYYSLYHNKRSVNGVSGFAPQGTLQLNKEIRSEGITTHLVGSLKKIGVGYMLLHTDQMQEIDVDIRSSDLEELVWTDEGIEVYELK